MRHVRLTGDETPKDKYERQLYLEDLQNILQTASGMRVFARLLLQFGVGSSQWGEGISIYRNVALRDAAEDVLQDIAEADETLHNNLQSVIRIQRSFPDGEQ